MKKAQTLREFLEHQINEDLVQAVMSGARGEDGPSRVKIRPILLRGEVSYQASAIAGSQVFHKNYTREALLDYIEASMGTAFSQLQTQGSRWDGTVLVSKKGKITIREKQRQPQTEAAPRILAHNRARNYILKEGTPVPFLVDLGVMTAEGKLISARYDKFRQINRFLEFIADILPRLPQNREITILDFGCGKSYLTFAMYYYLRELKGFDVSIIGLDLKADVIRNCNRLAKNYGYEKLHFLEGDIAAYEGVQQVDMVVTLHACDTATDYALARAVAWGAQVILSVPCCQHEVNRQIQNELLSPILKYGILKERMSALITDGIRANLLESQGYDTQVLEFIDMEHTPKNLLIRAVKKGTPNVGAATGPTPQGRGKARATRPREELERMMEELHVTQKLSELLRP